MGILPAGIGFGTVPAAEVGSCVLRVGLLPLSFLYVARSSLPLLSPESRYEHYHHAAVMDLAEHPRWASFRQGALTRRVSMR